LALLVFILELMAVLVHSIVLPALLVVVEIMGQLLALRYTDYLEALVVHQLALMLVAVVLVDTLGMAVMV
jgi:hypothetical protein